MQIKKDSAFDYEIALVDGAINQYPRTILYSQAEAVITTLDLVHVAAGRYNANYTYTGTDKSIKAHTIVYSDSGHTVENTTYNREHELIDVQDYAVAGDEMDLVNAPNSTAVTAIQSGLATGTNVSDMQTHGDSTWATATGFSTHSAADVKTALEVDGSKLDHLWEMTEDDGGTRRLTANALEQAPATDISDVKDVTDKLDTMLEADGDNYKFTSDALQEVAVSVDITTLESDVKRILGLTQENFYLDNPTFDSNSNLLTARVRVYSVAESVGTDDDVLATYNMTATFSAAGKVTTYQMVKE